MISNFYYIYLIHRYIQIVKFSNSEAWPGPLVFYKLLMTILLSLLQFQFSLFSFLNFICFCVITYLHPQNFSQV
jgi:hypothetical protein